MNYTADRMSPATHSRAPSAAHPESNPLLTALRTRLGLAGPVERPISHRFSEDLEDLRWDALNGVEYDEEDSLTRIGEDELPDDYDLDQQRHTFALGRQADVILANAKRKLNLLSDNLQGARHHLHSPSPTLSSVRYSDTVVSPQSTAPTTPSFDEDERPRSANVQRRPGQHLPFLLNTGLSRMPAEGSPQLAPTNSMRDVKSMDSMRESSHGSRPTLSPSFRQPSLFTLTEQHGGVEHGSTRVIRRAVSFRSPSKLPCVKSLTGHTDDLKERLVAMQLQTCNDEMRTPTFRSIDAPLNRSKSTTGQASRSHPRISPPLGQAGSALYLDYKALQRESTLARSNSMELLPCTNSKSVQHNLVDRNANTALAERFSKSRTDAERDFGHDNGQRIEIDGPFRDSLLSEGDDTVIHHHPRDEDEYVTQSQRSTPEASPLSTNETEKVRRHEDRDDAFDYEHFLLRSIVGDLSPNHRSSTAPKNRASPAMAESSNTLSDSDSGLLDQASLLISKIAPPRPQGHRAPASAGMELNVQYDFHRGSTSPDIQSWPAIPTEHGRDDWRSVWPVPPVHRSHSKRDHSQALSKAHKEPRPGFDVRPQVALSTAIVPSMDATADPATKEGQLIASLLASLRECVSKLENADAGVQSRIYTARLESARRALRGT